MSAGEPRLTGTSYAVLCLLELLGEATPYDLKQALETSIENFWPVPHTTFYAEPERLATAGLLHERREHEGRRRKVYSLTDAGRRALGSWRDAAPAAPPQLRDEGVLKLFAGGDVQLFLRSQRDHHRAKLAELDGYLAALPDERRWDGVRASLIAGTTYHRVLLAAMEEHLVEDDQTATAAASGHASSDASG